MRAALVVTTALLLAGAGAALAAGGGDDVRPPRITAGTTTAKANPKRNYCDAARVALEYQGTSEVERRHLVADTLVLSPAELVSTLETIRSSHPGSPEYMAAHRLWDYYNNNHCCNCYDKYFAPQISDLTPTQRQHIEEGKPL
jgi:hypothetical protein